MSKADQFKVLSAGLYVQIGRERFHVPFDRPEFEGATAKQLLEVQRVEDRLRWPMIGVEIPISSLARVVSARKLWAMKRKQQKRELEDLAAGRVTPESMMLIPPERIKEFTVIWPDDDEL